MDTLLALPEKDRKFITTYNTLTCTAMTVLYYTIRNTPYQLSDEDVICIHNNLMTIVTGMSIAIQTSVPKLDMSDTFQNNSVTITILDVYRHLFKQHGITEYCIEMVCKAAEEIKNNKQKG